MSDGRWVPSFAIRRLRNRAPPLIGLLGIAAETASIMVIYLDEGYMRWKSEGRIQTRRDLIDVAMESAVLRVRPLLMTVGMNIVGLVPVMFDTGIGSDVAKRIAAPVWGGLISLTLLTLAVIPALWVMWRERHVKQEVEHV